MEHISVARAGPKTKLWQITDQYYGMFVHSQQKNSGSTLKEIVGQSLTSR